MPSNWRNLAAGDPLWITLFGGHNSSTEKDVASGLIQDYALPSAPRDADTTINLAVYVQPKTSGQTVAQLGDIYAQTLHNYEYPLLARDQVGLTAGPAVRLTAMRPANGTAGSVDSRLVVCVLAGASRAYYLVFVSHDSTSTQYGTTFECMAQSLEFRA
jgi:hypothetical protein